MGADPRVRYVRTDTRGLSAARNVGLHLVHSALVGMTDDDCEVAPEWAGGIQRAFAQHPRVALLFGNVVPAPFDAAKGFIPHYERTAPFLATGLQQKMSVEGIGACMALRRDPIWRSVDRRELGAADRFTPGRTSISRARLASGHAVRNPHRARRPLRFHAGREPGADRSTVWRRRGYGKHVRPAASGHRLLARLAWRFIADGRQWLTALRRRVELRLRAFVQDCSRGPRLRSIADRSVHRSDPICPVRHF